MSNNSKNKKPRMTKKDLQTAKRLMKYMTGKYKFQFILVFFCILISAVATTAVSLSLRYLLDDFILPLIGQKSPDFVGLYKALTVLGCVFLAGVAATFIYTRMMVYIGQGVLKRVRDDMFEHMHRRYQSISLTDRSLHRKRNPGVSIQSKGTLPVRIQWKFLVKQKILACFKECIHGLPSECPR